MTAIITLTTIGTDAGPFNLYSNLDGYTSAFAVGITDTQLLTGYASDVVPDGTTIIRAKSFGICTNFIDLLILPAPTTTTTSSSSSTTTTTTTTAAVTFLIDSSLKDVMGQGTLDIIGGEPFEEIGLHFEMGVSGTFNSLSFSEPPLSVLVLDVGHLFRDGIMTLDGSGNATSIYTYDPTTADKACLVTVTTRSSGLPEGIGDTTNIF